MRFALLSHISPFIHYQKLPSILAGELNGRVFCLPQTSVAYTDHSCIGQCADTNEHMNRLNQPVQGTNEQGLLIDTKNRENERVNHTNHPQNPQSFGEDPQKTDDQ